MKSDLDIAQSVKLKPIVEIAESLGLSASDLELYGQYVAKIKLDALKHTQRRKAGKYIVVTAMTPTPLGEGKTVTTIGLSLGLNRIGKKAICTLRQPSLGPVFGIKGGAAGGGYSQVIPMEQFNLHLTGDFHAVSAANNLLAAFIDNHIQKGNKLGIDQFTVSWKRVLDVNDRSLRNVVTGLGNKRADGIPRETGFDITAASEVMAVLALASDLQDLRARLGRIVVGMNMDGKPVTAEQLQCAGAMAVLLKDAVKPNLMQTLEGTACIVHAGPFANIAHGNSSILADMMALRLADYVVTESGFGADMGFEKFCDIKCRTSGLRADAAVMVVTVRALKAHSALFQVVAGKPLDKGLLEENIPALRKGSANMLKHIENIHYFGLPVVAVINRFPTDTPAEIELVQKIALEAGATAAVVSEVHDKGGAGGEALANAVVEATTRKNGFDYLYPVTASIKEKIETIAHKLYGAGEVYYEPPAERQIRVLTENGLDKLPICMAKTHLSLSHDPTLKGRPHGFRMPVREVRAFIGAGFLTALCGEIPTMPGLPSVPGGTRVDIDEDGKVVGLF
jgi:formate--tetrahydrofolate ligase